MSKYITNQINQEGFGAQYQRIICTILYAYFLNKEFVYTKPNLSVVYEEESNFIESIMNLSKFFKSVDDIDKSQLEIADIGTVFSIFDKNIDNFINSDTMKKIISIFKENKKLYLLDNKYNNIVIHIRRPSIHKNIDIPKHHGMNDVKNMNVEDIVNINKEFPRFTLDDYYLDIINKLRNKYTSKKNKFHIVSEGKIDTFKNFIADDVTFHLNKDLSETITLMVISDIFVMSNSSFSYVAALLNENEIIYQDFWHIKASHWLTPSDI
jgi:hypothetical protein